MQSATKPVSWIKAARKDFAGFPQAAQLEGLLALSVAAEGIKTPKPTSIWSGAGSNA